MSLRLKMANTAYWLKQTEDKPLFPDLLWSRPENKRFAGKLLIIGGNAHGFAAAAQAYAEADRAGIGVAKVLLPDALKKTVGETFEAAEFAPSTPSGSLSQKALDSLLDLADWADGVLIAGELGRNAETAALLEKFVNKTVVPITITKDAIEVFNSSAFSVLSRPSTALVLSIAQLQTLNKEVKFPEAVTFSMDMVRLVEYLHSFTKGYEASIILKHLDNIFVACKGRVSTTKDLSHEDLWRIPTAARAAVWWLQNPNKPFEALTTAVGAGGGTLIYK